MKNKKTNILFVIFVSLFFIVGCSNNPSEGSGEEAIIFNDYYSFNSTYHWREASEGYEKTDYEIHDFELVQETPATYQQQGKKVYRCKVCNYRKEEKTKKLTHTYDESFTYDEHGHWRVCVDEGYEGLKTDYSTHSYVSETVQEADYEHELITKYTCSVCGYHYELTGDCLHHNYDEKYTADETGHWHACLDEEYPDLKKDFEKHTFSEEILAEPTFEEKGSTKYTCSVCGFSYTIDTDEQKHNFSNEFEYDENYHWHLCVDKGYESIIDEKVEHVFEERIVDPTYDNDGYTLHTCTKCGYEYTDNTIAHLEHHYSEEYEHDNYRHWRVCVDKGYEDLKFGLEMHHYSKEVTEPTFTEYGWTVYTCEDCGFTFTQNGHSYKPHSYSDEYQSSNEGHWHKCIDEGFEELNSDIENHVLGNWQVEAYPTSTEEGTAYRACNYCGYHQETISIPTNTAYLPEHFYYSINYPGNGDPFISIEGLKLSSASMVIIPEIIGSVTVTSIGSYAFSDRSFQRIIIPETITNIGNNALQNCNSLTEIYFPASLNRLNQYVLSYCNSLTKIEIPGIERMEYYSIAYCRHLINLHLPESLSYIDVNVLYGLDDLENIYVDENNQYFTSLDGVLYSKTLDRLVKFPAKNENTCLYYGKEVRGIYSGNTLNDCDNITEVNLGMNDYLPTAILSLKNLNAFIVDENNAYFKTRQNGRVLLNYDEDRLYFVSRAYENSFTVPSSVENINDQAFYHCDSITSISMNNSITYIGSSAFSYCSSLSSITLSNSLSQLNWGLLSYCTSLSSINISNNITNISDYAFQGCSSLMSVTIPNSVTEIGYGAFYGCESLVSVSLSNQIVTIPDYAFYNCHSLESIEIPESVRYIRYAAFAYCTSLLLLDIPSTVEYMDYYVIESNNSSTISVVIGPTVTSMSSSPIYHYNGSTNIFFKGTQSDWNNYSNSSNLTSSLSSYIIYYYSDYQPTSSGNYWHYVNGVPEAW